MNDRMYELINQCFIGTTDGKFSSLNTVANVEKFAELIVREMLGLLEQYSRDSFPEDIMDDFDKGYQAGLHTAQKAVKEHFGVEE